ncbi:RnfABCDGE type electron transport complex subunit D [Ruminococcus sp.]|jgi:Na+-translocating ferredoxin:NAD+ oxidoreductase RnfD subunit|uniref:RnfABCDGE type electron transport complex subunit D n=1 Tax=Ruminococcus sp. TaxID=41978 RepID=UPI0025EBB488|nr:RnfABCDGE type electron transport complex subunit D [Ruminococcus sp.]
MLKKARKERLIWLDIMITLLTLELMSYFYYGIRSVVLAGVCVITAFIAEIVSLRMMKRRFTADDLTCTSDAMILALMFPAVMDYKIAVIAVLFAVIAAKNVFGGRLNMIFSPAATAYIFVLTSWGHQLLQYTEPHVKTGIFETPTGLVNSASHTFNMTGNVDHTDFELLLGNFSGPCGSVSILLLVVAAVVLIFRRSISAGAFIGTIFGTGFFACVTPMISSRADSFKYSLVMNMVLFSAIYIVSDIRIAPKRNYYAFFYGLFIGVISYVLVLTMAKENAIVIVSVLFTPIALGFKNLEKRIEKAASEHTSEEDNEDSENVTAGKEMTVSE